MLPDAPDEHEQLTFLRLVAELTPLHVRMLAVLAEPEGWFVRHPELEKPSFGISSGLAPEAKGEAHVTRHATGPHRGDPPSRAMRRADDSGAAISSGRQPSGGRGA